MLKLALVAIPGVIAIALVWVTLSSQLPFWLLASLWIVGFLVAIIVVTLIELKIKLDAMRKQNAQEDTKPKE